MEYRFLPKEYIQVEYLQSTGTQYIDTGVVGNNTERVIESEFKIISYDKQYQGIFGNYVNESTKTTRLSFVSNSKLSSWFCHSGNTATYNGFNAIVGSWVKLHLDNDKLVLNSNSITKTTTVQSGSENTTSMALFSQHLGTTYASPMACKYFKIWDNGTLVRDFVPAKRKLDNVLGMYDITKSDKNLLNDSEIYRAQVNTEPNHFRYKSVLIKAGETYTFSIQNKTGVNKDLYIGASTIDNFTGSVNYITVTPTNSYTVSPTVDTYYCAYFSGSETSLDTCIACKAMLEKGSVKTTYERNPFYTNQGTGTFISGNEVKCPIKLPYIRENNTTKPVLCYDSNKKLKLIYS